MSEPKIQPADGEAATLTRRLAQPDCGPKEAAAVLLHALRGGSSVARPVGMALTVAQRRDPYVAGLRILCLAPEEFKNAEQAAEFVGHVRLDRLTASPEALWRGQVLLARCAEAAADWMRMVVHTDGARRIAPLEPDVRYWSARAALRNRRPVEADRELAQPPSAPTPRWLRLAVVAALAARPGDDRVEACFKMLAGAFGPITRSELSLVPAALEPSFRVTIADSPERLKVLSRLAERVMKAFGPLPWVRYVFAVKAMVVDCAFDDAASFLTSEVTAPDGAWPVAILRAVCGVMLGRVGMMRVVRVPLPRFAAEIQFLELFGDALAVIAENGDLVTLARRAVAIPATPLRLVGLAPLLPKLVELFRDVVRCLADKLGREKPTVRFADLTGCLWGLWLWFRLWTARTPFEQVARTMVKPVAPTFPQSLGWDRLVWLQEFAALLQPAPASLIEAALTATQTGLPKGSDWLRPIALRRMLLGRPNLDPQEPTSAQNAPTSSCPWWPTDGVLQVLAAREAEVEFRYLQGRYALRRGDAAGALELFRSALKNETPSDTFGLADDAARRAKANGQDRANGVSAALIRARFAPVLAYWEGVAQAHLGCVPEARAKLGSCLDGPKAWEARAQLGLLEVAAGNLAAANAQLLLIPEPRPPAARYLSGLLVERRGDLDAARRLLIVVSKAIDSSSVYSSATNRLLAVLEERAGDDAAARAAYEVAGSALNDGITRCRHARFLLRGAYARLRKGEVPAHRPLRIDNATAVYPSWVNILRQIGDALASFARPEFDRATLTLGGGALPNSWSAQKRLALCAQLADGKYRAASESAGLVALEAAKVGLDPRDPLQTVLQLFGAATDLALASEGIAFSTRLAARVAELARLRARHPNDSKIAFWHDATRLFVDASALCRDNLFADLLRDDVPISQRAFAAVARMFAGSQARQSAAETVRELLTQDGFATKSARDVAESLLEFTAGGDEEFLRRYDAAVAIECDLPFDRIALLCCATESRLRVGDFDRVIKDLDAATVQANPRLRDALVLALARRASNRAELDSSGALADCEQALRLVGVQGPNASTAAAPEVVPVAAWESIRGSVFLQTQWRASFATAPTVFAVRIGGKTTEGDAFSDGSLTFDGLPSTTDEDIGIVVVSDNSKVRPHEVRRFRLTREAKSAASSGTSHMLLRRMPLFLESKEAMTELTWDTDGMARGEVLLTKADDEPDLALFEDTDPIGIVTVSPPPAGKPTAAIWPLTIALRPSHPHLKEKTLSAEASSGATKWTVTVSLFSPSVVDEAELARVFDQLKGEVAVRLHHEKDAADRQRLADRSGGVIRRLTRLFQTAPLDQTAVAAGLETLRRVLRPWSDPMTPTLRHFEWKVLWISHVLAQDLGSIPSAFRDADRKTIAELEPKGRTAHAQRDMGGWAAANEKLNEMVMRLIRPPKLRATLDPLALDLRQLFNPTPTRAPLFRPGGRPSPWKK